MKTLDDLKRWIKSEITHCDKSLDEGDESTKFSWHVRRAAFLDVQENIDELGKVDVPKWFIHTIYAVVTVFFLLVLCLVAFAVVAFFGRVF